MYDSLSGYRILVRKALDVTQRFSEKAKAAQKALKAALFQYQFSLLSTKKYINKYTASIL